MSESYIPNIDQNFDVEKAAAKIAGVASSEAIKAERDRRASLIDPLEPAFIKPMTYILPEQRPMFPALAKLESIANPLIQTGKDVAQRLKLLYSNYMDQGETPKPPVKDLMAPRNLEAQAFHPRKRKISRRIFIAKATTVAAGAVGGAYLGHEITKQIMNPTVDQNTARDPGGNLVAPENNPATRRFTK